MAQSAENTSASSAHTAASRGDGSDGDCVAVIARSTRGAAAKEGRTPPAAPPPTQASHSSRMLAASVCCSTGIKCSSWTLVPLAKKLAKQAQSCQKISANPKSNAKIVANQNGVKRTERFTVLGSAGVLGTVGFQCKHSVVPTTASQFPSCEQKFYKHGCYNLQAVSFQAFVCFRPCIRPLSFSHRDPKSMNSLQS